MQKIVCIVGANASGKSTLAVNIALSLKSEVVSADSRQVYKDLNLGTGKLTRTEMRGVTHHMIDVVEATKSYTLFEYKRDAERAIASILSSGNIPILVGGTGLYVDAIAEGYQLVPVPPNPELRKELERLSSVQLVEMLSTEQPAALEFVDTRNPRRLIRALEVVRSGLSYAETRNKKPTFEAIKIGISWDREELRHRIYSRLIERIEAGMVEEVVMLREKGVKDGFLFDLGLEYRYILMYLRGEIGSMNNFKESLFTAICQYAKRQYTWFKRDKMVRWYDGGQLNEKEILSLVLNRTG